MGRMLGLIAAAFFILIGCSAQPDPATSTLSTPTPTPTPAVPATPSPPNLTDTLKAAAGQDISLSDWEAGYPALNQCPGFGEYTGYPLLEHPPARVVRYIRSYAGGLCCETFHVVDSSENYSISVLLTGTEAGVPQELHITLTEPYPSVYVTGEITAEDVNFDSCQDILIGIGGGRGGQHYRAALLCDPATGIYSQALSFSEISAARADPESCIVWGGSDFTYAYTQRAYEYLAGEFVETHALVVDHMATDWSLGQRCTEYALVDGVLAEVASMEFPGYQDEFPIAMDAYISAGAAWPGWANCDPWAFHQYG